MENAALLHSLEVHPNYKHFVEERKCKKNGPKKNEITNQLGNPNKLTMSYQIYPQYSTSIIVRIFLSKMLPKKQRPKGNFTKYKISRFVNINDI